MVELGAVALLLLFQLIPGFVGEGDKLFPAVALLFVQMFPKIDLRDPVARCVSVVLDVALVQPVAQMRPRFHEN